MASLVNTTFMIITCITNLLVPTNYFLTNETKSDACVTFRVGPGTGCAWMCNYCSNALGTNNYYFTDGVCHYETGGCVGNPQADTDYTCCGVVEESTRLGWNESEMLALEDEVNKMFSF